MPIEQTTGTVRDVYAALVDTQDKMIEALQAGRGRDYMELKQAYDTTAEGNPELMSYLDRTARSEAGINPRRALAASKALPSYFEAKARDYNLNPKVLEDTRSDMYWETRYGMSPESARLQARRASGQLDPESDDAARAAAEFGHLSQIKTKLMRYEGYDDAGASYAAGNMLRARKDVVEGSMAGSEVLGGKVPRSLIMSTRYEMADAADNAGVTPTAAFGVVDRVADLMAASYTQAGSKTAGSETPTGAVPYTTLYREAASTVSNLLKTSTSDDTMSVFADLVGVLRPTDPSGGVAGTAFQYRNPFELRSRLNKLVDSVGMFDEKEFVEDAAAAGLTSADQLKEARKSILYLNAASNGALVKDTKALAEHAAFLGQVGLGNYVPADVEQSATMNVPGSVHGRLSKKLTQAGIAVKNPAVLQQVEAAVREEAVVKNAVDSAQELLTRAGVSTQTRDSIKTMSTIVGSGITTAEQAERALIALDPLVKAAPQGEARDKLVELQTKLTGAKAKLTDVSNRSYYGLARQEADLIGGPVAPILNGLMETRKKAADEIQANFVRAGGMSALRASIKALGAVIDPGSTASESWRSTARQIVQDHILSSKATIPSMGGMPMSEWGETLSAADVDELVDLYSARLTAGIAEGASVTASSGDLPAIERTLVARSLDRLLRYDPSLQYDHKTRTFSREGRAKQYVLVPDRIPMYGDVAVTASVLPALTDALLSGSTVDRNVVADAMNRMASAEARNAKAEDTLRASADSLGIPVATLRALLDTGSDGVAPSELVRDPVAALRARLSREEARMGNGTSRASAAAYANVKKLTSMIAELERARTGATSAQTRITSADSRARYQQEMADIARQKQQVYREHQTAATEIARARLQQTATELAMRERELQAKYGVPARAASEQ